MSQTIDQIFLSYADKKGDEISLSAAATPARLGLPALTELSYQNAATYIRRTASHLREMGFNEGDVIFVQIPNIMEAPLLLLSIINAGLVPALIPNHWRGTELAEAFAKLPPRALFTHRAEADYDPFPTSFELAAAHMGLRYIFGIGQDLPDGVTPLKDITETLATAADHSAPEQKAMLRRSGEHVALISWTRDEACSIAPVAYTHLQLMANAHLLVSSAAIDQPLSILTAYGPTNPAGLIGAFLPWMMEGGKIHLTTGLKQCLDAKLYESHSINLALLPESIGPKATSISMQGDPMSAPHLFLVAPTPHSPTPSCTLSAGLGGITSLINLNGLCLIPRQIDITADEGLMYLGPQPGPEGEIVNPPFIECRLQGATQKAGNQGDVLRGRLELNGTAIGFTQWQPDMTTARHFNFNDHWEKTGLKASIINQALNRLAIEAPDEGTVYYASTPFNSAELDRLYSSYPGIVDAAAFTIKDATLGERLLAAIIPAPGEPLSYSEFRQHLLTQNISPAKIPEKLVTVEEIPRNEEGFVTRSAILSHP